MTIQRGYDRRMRHPWSIARWQTFYLMQSFSGSKSMGEAGLHRPTDLLLFPWEKERGEEMSEEEIEEIRKEIAAANRAIIG